jgi:hypothetical protein
MTEQRDIKETLEVLKAVETLTETVGLVAADGKVNVADLVHLLNVVKNVQVFVEAVKGAKLIPAEVKDLSQEELVQVGAAALAIAKKVTLIVKPVVA